MQKRKLLQMVFLTALVSIPGNGDLIAAQGDTTRVSVDSSGNQAAWHCGVSSISADGRYVGLGSTTSDLVPGDTNLSGDAFVHDRQTGVTTRVSVDSSGNQATGHSGSPSISADGRYVAFMSLASDLVPGDTNGDWDIFVHDRQTGATTRVSVDSSGNQATGTEARGSKQPSISADGRYVAFKSNAPDLVPGDTNEAGDIFVHDRQTGATTRVSVDSSGNQVGHSFGPSISADGRYVVFHSSTPDLVPGDTNGGGDVFVHDRQTGATTRVSVDSSGAQATRGSWNPSISADGRYVAFDSEASNLVIGDTNYAWDVFVHDRQTGATTRVSVDSSGNQATGVATMTSIMPGGLPGSRGASISADGRYVAFSSFATNLVPGDTNDAPDVFVHDRQTGATTRVSVDSSGTQANSIIFTIYGSYSPVISADGRYVAFNSEASNLVAGDTNDVEDVFVHDYLGEPTSDQCATFDSQTNILHIPCVIIDSLSYWIELEPVSSTLELRGGGANTGTESSASECASFNYDSNILYIPCVYVGGISYWLELELISGDPCRFAVEAYGSSPD